MNDSENLQMNINSIIGFISTVIGIVGLILAGMKFYLIAMIIFGCFAIVGLWLSRKTWLRLFRSHPPSPYHPSKSVTPPDFVGRDSLLRDMTQALENGESLSIIGDEYIGKTSLLQTWQQQLQTTKRTVVLVDGLQIETTLPAFIEAITEQTAPDNSEQAADILKDWALASNKPTGLSPLLLIDNAEPFLKQLEIRFFERLRGLLNHCVVVFATSREMNRIFAELGKTSPLALRILHIDLLDESGSEQLRAKGHFTVQQFEWIKEWAGQHPYYIQLLGQELFNARQYGEPDEKALRRFRTNANARFLKLWATLTQPEQRILQTACQTHEPIQRDSLKERGLVTEDGQLFGRVFKEWMLERE
jgi:energy-coupling factor transporter ATP-binding protein EcfA2/uncharacterized protein YneF (UPF0154 family)